MMTEHTLPISWSVNKFASRYGLHDDGSDFYINGAGKLVVFPTLPDDPPIFEAPDPPPPTITSLINAPMVPPLSPALKTILLRLAAGR